MLKVVRMEERNWSSMNMSKVYVPCNTIVASRGLQTSTSNESLHSWRKCRRRIPNLPILPLYSRLLHCERVIRLWSLPVKACIMYAEAEWRGLYTFSPHTVLRLYCSTCNLHAGESPASVYALQTRCTVVQTLWSKKLGDTIRLTQQDISIEDPNMTFHQATESATVIEVHPPCSCWEPMKVLQYQGAKIAPS